MTEPDAVPIDVLLARAARSIPVPDPGMFAAAVADRIRAAPVQSDAPRRVGASRRTGWTAPRRRTGALVAGLVAASVLVVTAVAPVRSAVADFLGVDGIHITRAVPIPVPPARSTIPPPPPPSTTIPVDPIAALHLGQATTLVEAARRVGFPMRLPTVGAYQQPDAVYVGTPPPGGMASMVYLPKPNRPAVRPGGVAALLTEFRGHLEAGFFQKLIGGGTTVEAVRVGSVEGYWLSGAPHEFFYVNPDGSVDTETIRLATDTLVWSAGGITYRFESALPRDDAVVVATSMR
jgi:hypothetical protein